MGNQAGYNVSKLIARNKIKKATNSVRAEGAGPREGRLPWRGCSSMGGAGLALSVPAPRLDGQAKERAALPATAVLSGFPSQYSPAPREPSPQKHLPGSTF